MSPPPPPSPTESSRRALVTGGSRGIGAAVSRALAADGWTVAVHCRSSVDTARRLVGQLHGSGHGHVVGDIAVPDEARRIVTDAADAVGPLDLLVNNAAVYEELDPATATWEAWTASWTRVVDVNLHGTANVTWAFVRQLLDRPSGPEGGCIVTIGSRGAFRGEPGAPAYGATKAAVHAFSQSLAVALGPHGIGVVAVAPGFVRTDMAEAVLTSPRGAAIRAQSPFDRVAEPEEVASAVTWLASPAAVWASGSVLDLNGASYLR